MSIDRLSLEKAVARLSPLTPAQFDRLFHDDVSRETLWRFMNLTAKHQMAAYNVLSAFPEAKVENVK